jgi:hypothetical protein
MNITEIKANHASDFQYIILELNSRNQFIVDTQNSLKKFKKEMTDKEF